MCADPFQRAQAAEELPGGRPTAVIFAVVLVLAVIGNFIAFDGNTPLGALLNFLLSPVVLVVAAGVAGLCIRGAKGALNA